MVLAIGTATGFGTAYLALASGWQPSALRIGPWEVVHGAGAGDPYARSITARTGDVPLGGGEGVLLVAREDSAGRPLAGACTYRMVATIPAARAWTLTLTDRDGRLVDNPSARHVLTSGALLRPLTGPANVGVAAEPLPGNWLPAPAEGGFQLVLRLYETPASNSLAALEADALPAIERQRCR